MLLSLQITSSRLWLVFPFVIGVFCCAEVNFNVFMVSILCVYFVYF